MTTEMSTQKTGTDGKARSVVRLTLVLGAVLAALVALVLVTEREAQAASAEKIVLSHCSVAEALSLGSGIGIGLFQGWHVDALLRGIQPPVLKLCR